MKYIVSCYNGGPFFKLDWGIFRPDETRVVMIAKSEEDAIIKAKKKVHRDYYKVIEVIG